METHRLDEIPELYPIILQNLRRAAERTKKLLTTKEQSTIIIKDFHDGKDLNVVLTKDKLNNLCANLVLLCMMSIENALESSGLNKDEIDEIIMVGGATRMPLIRDKITTYFNKVPNTTVNPDEVVAVGASIQAYIINNKHDAFSQGVTLLDITPLSLGVEVAGGVMDVIIPRNTNIPTKVIKSYTNDTDYDKSILIKIFEGERMLTKDNFSIGEFLLDDIKPEPKGSAIIEISFNIDINGIILVTAEDKKSESIKSIRVTGNKNKLSEDKINQLVIEAKEMELLDRQNRELRNLNYKLNDLISSLKYSLSQENPIPTHKVESAKKIIEDFSEILTIKQINDISKQEYVSMINEIMSKYETLILNSYSIEKDTKKLEQTEKANATTLYNDDDEEIITNTVSNTDKRYAYEARDTLTEECHELFSMINNGGLDYINESDRIKLKEYLNDVLMWIYIKMNLRKEDYDNKLKELNKLCDEIFEKNKKISSEQLLITCNTILKFMTNVDENDVKLLELISETINAIKYNNIIDIEERNEQIEQQFNTFYNYCMGNNKGTAIEDLRSKNN